MRTKPYYIIGLVILLFLADLLIYRHYHQTIPSQTQQEELRHHSQLPEIPHKKEKTHFQAGDFSQLPGWQYADARQSLRAFQISCKVFLKQDPEQEVGSQHINLKAKDWQPACKAALAFSTNNNEISEKNARLFFETWFTPVTFYDGRPLKGLFTGYYMPILAGSLVKTKTHSVPIYGLPKNLITADLGQFDPQLKHHRHIVGRLKKQKLIPYYTRAQINDGALGKSAPIVAWINSVVERQFLEIEGSGIIQLKGGKKLYIGYAGQNGAPYTPIARVLINKGVMTRHNASMQKICNYFKEHPQQINSIINQNKSFVFFKTLTQEAAMGAQGVPLTPGYSLAIDRKWVPLGAPIWLNTTRPDQVSNLNREFQRLMIAQDTGGAIRGAVRGDVYWGDGDEATYIAGHMKNEGFYWLLLPKSLATSLHNKKLVV